MAKWLAKDKRRSCKVCQMFKSPESFIKGAKVRIAEAFDCANCEVTLSQPIPDNENIIDLYEALPQNYDGLSGAKDVGAEAIQFIFQIYDIHTDLWEDYYNRIQFFHKTFLDARSKTEQKKQKRKDAMAKMKKGQDANKPESTKRGVRTRK